MPDRWGSTTTAGRAPIARPEGSTVTAGRAPIARPVGFITKLPHGRGSSSCWGKRKLAQKQEQAGLPCPAGTWVNEPSARAWELGLLKQHESREGSHCPPGWLASEITAGAWEHRLLLMTPHTEQVRLPCRTGGLYNHSRASSHARPVGWEGDRRVDCTTPARAWELGLLEKPTNRPCVGAVAAGVRHKSREGAPALPIGGEARLPPVRGAPAAETT